MLRAFIAVGCVIGGATYLLAGSGSEEHLRSAMLLPVASVACIVLLWE